MALVEVSKLNKAFGIVELFNDLSFKLNNNEKLAIIGPNGCGKTTLLRMLVGQETIDEGTIIIRPKTSVGYLSQMMLHSLDNSLYQRDAWSL
jgi:ATPase subunit of ABC transporter with duplicated ATPase domains